MTNNMNGYENNPFEAVYMTELTPEDRFILKWNPMLIAVVRQEALKATLNEIRDTFPPERQLAPFIQDFELSAQEVERFSKYRDPI